MRDVRDVVEKLREEELIDGFTRANLEDLWAWLPFEMLKKYAKEHRVEFERYKEQLEEHYGNDELDPCEEHKAYRDMYLLDDDDVA